jgi:nucleotide-binding universal stress UspA family protein
MILRRIVAATDDSDAGRQAVRTAVQLGARTSAQVTVLRVMAVEVSHRLVGAALSLGPSAGEYDETELVRLHQWLRADVLSLEEMESTELAITYGIPGVEICRFAERAEADLLVLGRKRHSQMTRLLLGDTADAVARRSRFPCLFVPPGPGELVRVLASLDGSDRGIDVLNQSCDFARYVGATLQAITVESRPGEEPMRIDSTLPLTRSSSLKDRVQHMMANEGFPDGSLIIQRGDILERILAQVQETDTDVLAIGYHRGGPPGVLEAGSIARRLAHAVPCAVLTIPL